MGFPGSVMPLTIGRRAGPGLLDEALTADKIIGAITQRNESAEDPQPQDLYSYGTASLILKMVRSPEGRASILTHRLGAFRVLEIIETEPYMRAKVEVIPDVQPEVTPAFEVLVKSVRAAAERMIQRFARTCPRSPATSSTALTSWGCWLWIAGGEFERGLPGEAVAAGRD